MGGVICLFLLLALCSPEVVGANPQTESIVRADSVRRMNARHYTMADGLPSNTIRCIHQDKQGFIWIGTANGLCRYDGYQFNVFLPSPPDSNTPGLASNSVTNIFEDMHDHLWIQCSPQRLCCFDLKSGQFVDFTGNGEYNNSFTKPVLLPDGDLWTWNDSCVYGITHLPDGRLQSTQYNRALAPFPQGTIRFANKDSDGWVWIGATDGLSCIDPQGGVHLADSTKNWIQSYAWEDEIHFVTQDGTLWFNPDNTSHIEMTTTLAGMSAKDKVVNENKTAHEWFIMTNRRTYFYDMKQHTTTRNKRFIYPTPRLVHMPDKSVFVYNQPEAVYYMDSTYTDITPLPLRKVQDGRPGYENYRMESHKNGEIWISTGENGLFVFHPQTKRLHRINHKENPDLLQTDALHDVCIDREGTVWIGTSNAGLTKLSHAQQPVHRRILPIDTEEKGYENYVRLLNWKDDTLWVGTRRNLLQCYDKDFNLLSNENVATNIYSMETDTTGVLWKGTRGKGLIINGKEIRHRREVEKALQNGDIFKIFKDSKGRMWLGTFGGGLCLVTQDSTTQDGYAFRHFLTESYGMLRIRDLAEDGKGHIWAATNDGLCIFHPDSLIADPTAYYHYSYTNNQFPATEIHALLTDRQSGENVWCGSIGQGLIQCTFNEEKGLDYTTFSTDDGLASNTVTSLLHDDLGFIWIGTSQGLSRLDPSINSLHSFTFSKDPQGNCFSEGTSCKLPDGRLVFGTIHGMVVLDPRTINVTKSSADIAITELWVNGSSVPYVEEEGRNSSISHARHIRLEHTQSSFELHFSDMIFNEGHNKKRFRWYMEGYDKEWKQSSTRNYASYQYLQPGTYTFHVETTDNDGLWSEKEAKLKITILPPWWQTWWFKAVCLILLGTVMYIIFKQVNRIAGLRRRIKVEKELSSFKTSFFANLSHEFRTPLTLIQVALERTKKAAPQTKAMKQAIDTMQQGTDRMARLTYEIMQFHKMEASQLSLALRSTDIVAFIHNIVMNFNGLAQQKGITLNFKSWQETYTLPIDRNHIDKIAYNLLSNAFKYTPSESGCDISVELCMKDDKTLMMTVTDTGIGVPAEKRNELFSRYMRTRMSGNSVGIGLNLSAELARVHHGALEYRPHIVEDSDGNKKEKGSIFTLCLPASPDVYTDEEFLKVDEGIPLEEDSGKDNVLTETETSTETEGEGEETETGTPINPQRLLVVEDDADIRNMLVEELGELFEVFTATDGQEGTDKAKELMPDLIISDVMMPRMDGFELTRRLKKDFNTSHIPIILLTALYTPEKQTKGFEEGADAYISKPFNRDVLRARIVQLINQRQRLRDKFSKEPETQSSEICTTSQDRNFLTQVDELIEQNIANSDLRIEDLARELGMSRTVFYNKIKGITGYAPVEYLRLARLKKASKILAEQPDASMADVSYSTGFNDPLYFSRVFKKHFGVSPSNYGKPRKGEARSDRSWLRHRQIE